MRNYIFASCLTSAPSCGTLAAIPNPKSFSCLDEKSTGLNRFISEVFKIICIVRQIKLHIKSKIYLSTICVAEKNNGRGHGRKYAACRERCCA